MLETHTTNLGEDEKYISKKIMNIKTSSRPLLIQSDVSDKFIKVERENVGLLSYLLETVERRKYKKNVRKPYPVITRLDMVRIDWGTVLQELLLKILEWFAFIVTDILFRVIWPI